MVRPSVVVNKLHEELKETLDRLGFPDVSIFGSIARGTDSPSSDVDLMLHTTKKLGLMRIMDIANAVESLLSVPVDVTIDDGRNSSRLASARREAVPL